jgi:hypothetical protein
MCGDIPKAADKRFKLAAFRIRWDGSIVRRVTFFYEDDLNDVPTGVYKYGTQ